MPTTDLPSREKFNEQYPDDWPVGWRDVLDAYASGRLVDRDAIDYEAAADQKLFLGFDWTIKGQRYALAELIIAAAIGDTDD